MGRRRGAGATVGTVAGTAVDAAVAGEVGAVATKAAGRVTKRAGRAARKAGAAAEQAGENVRRGRGPLTPARARRMIGLGKVVLPLLAPYALASAGVARARWDAYRAARLGVTPVSAQRVLGPRRRPARPDRPAGGRPRRPRRRRRGPRHHRRAPVRPRVPASAGGPGAGRPGRRADAAAAPQDRAPGGLRRARPDRADPAGPPGRRPNGLTPRPPEATEAARAAARRTAPFDGRHTIYRPPLEGRHPPRFGGRGRCDLSVGAASL